MIKQIRKRFQRELPEIYQIATHCSSESEFNKELKEYANKIINEESSGNTCRYLAANRLLALLNYESTYINEFSKGEKIFIETLSYLWNFLKGHYSGVESIDMYEDLFQIFIRTKKEYKQKEYTFKNLSADMNRWPAGCNKEVHRIRMYNKRRIIELLVKKIEKRANINSRYNFKEITSHSEKIKMVEEWWNDFRFHLVMAIKDPTELNLFLDESLSAKIMRILNRAKNKKIPFFITPYYLSLLNTSHKGYDDLAIRNYILYSESLVNIYGNIKAWEREDEVVSGEPNAAGWILPPGNNIHRRYPEVAIFIPDTRGRSCGGLCASCQRMYDFQRERLNFDMDSLKPTKGWSKKLTGLMDYFEHDPYIKDILITGGDALMSKNSVLEEILDEVLKMTLRKREANNNRGDTERLNEIKRIRLGSRIPAYLPVRINKELIDILKNFRIKALKAGIKQFIIQTHFQSPLEITAEAAKTIKDILSTGWIITNQLVFTTSVSRRGHTAKLRQVLNSLGIITYYTFTVKGFDENCEMFTPNSRSMQEQKEEKKFGSLSSEQQQEFLNIFNGEENIPAAINRFLKKEKLPFLPTDRNVLNLPAVGKSMTFEMVGLTKEGRRILRFDHDKTRKHSKIIDEMGEIYIVENRSILSYLNDMEKMGEKVRNYNSIWSYTSGLTEPVFPLFDYPD